MLFSRSEKPILVTGTPRSGTTWTGRMIARSRHVSLVMEPFGDNGPMKASGVSAFQHNFPYMPTSQQQNQEALKAVRQLLAEHQRFRIPDTSQLPIHKRLIAAILNRTPIPCRPLLKDPSVPLMAEWFSDTFEAEVVVLVRHPVAVADSFVRKMKWGDLFDPTSLLDQPELMADWFYPFEGLIKHPPNDPYLRVAIMWLCLNHVLHSYCGRHPEWNIHRHEDLASDPDRAFSDIFSRLNLPFGSRESEYVREFSSSQNPVEAPGGAPEHIQRNSKQLPTAWKGKVPQNTVDEIRQLTEPLASEYYSNDDW